MALNEELTWADVGSITTGDETTVADAFQLGFDNPTKDLLSKGMQIYKFNSYPSISKEDPPPADCPMSHMLWTASIPYKHDGGLVQKLKIADANGVSARE